MRKLATIQRITEIKEIPNAQNIVCAKIKGWQSVVKKGEFKPNDLVVFAEIDSILPFATWTNFLKDKKNPDKPIRLKTCKLRGVISQGVIFKISDIPELRPYHNGNGTIKEYQEGDCLDEILGVKKYEPYVTAQLTGIAKGNFPTHICPKTDAERIQNLWGDRFLDEIHGTMFVARQKVDGTSFTCFNHNGELGVCSRNMLLKIDGDEGSRSAVYVKMFYDCGLDKLLTNLGLNIAIQAEIVGRGIQKNKMGLPNLQLRVFDVYDIDNQRYYDYDRLVEFCVKHNLPQVKTLTDVFVFDKLKHDFDYLIKMTEQKYDGTNQQIEGLVFTPVIEKHSPIMQGRLRFKVINPDYLIENE